MEKIQVKRIRERILRIQNAWNEGAAPVTEFRNTVKTNLDADIAAARAIDDEIDDLKAQLAMKEDERDMKYMKLDTAAVDVRKGVEGSKDFGDDSALYGAMGFVRKSERKTGLTRKTKTNGNDGGETT